MKYAYLVFTLCSVMLATSCGTGTGNKTAQADQAEGADVVIVDTTSVDPQSPVEVILEAPEYSYEVTGTITGLQDTRTYTVQAKTGQTLNLQLSAGTSSDDMPANIRINQLISPSGSADGPFGRTLEQKLTEDGSWTIIIGESLMQGDDYSGEYSLAVELK